ncbi:transglutaminase-like domain-containing protein [Actinoplanes sp. NPDC048791]|uniref:transglutaminase-like domain-containing protein n=1 Tax=Actinoplanes sp. NPDC048791 TaxID=3154623 RepID=UPI0033DBD0DC
MVSEWVEPGVMTAAGKYAGLLDGLPAHAAGIARVVQGLLIHEFWADAYGVTLAEPDRDRVNLRRVEQVLDAVSARDDRPLDVPRAPEQRIATNCRGFSVMAVALFRARGVPARARCGFGTYFKPGWFEDHWVAEYLDGGRWKLLDAQIDGLQRRHLGLDFDLTDVSRDQFVIAGDAWTRTRAGQAGPDRFGLTMINEAGAWWIAANLMRDAAALDKMELLPWDLWGAMPEPADTVDVALFDELAAATAEPSMADVRRLLADDRLRVPAEVFNVQHGRKEALA